MPKTRKGRETRGRLLQAGRELIKERGYSGLQVNEIAERAGVSAAAFYRYFSDRRALTITLLNGLVEDAYAEVRSTFQERDPKQSVRQTTLRYFSFYEANQDLFGVMMHLVPGDKEVVALWHESQQAFYARIERAFRRGVAAGVVRADPDLRLMTEMLAGMSEFYAFRRFALGLGPWTSATVTEAASAVAEVWAAAVLENAQTEASDSVLRRDQSSMRP